MLPPLSPLVCEPLALVKAKKHRSRPFGPGNSVHPTSPHKVIAGDSWGTIAVPVIEAYPGTAFIFVGSLLTLVFGVLNLIVAATCHGKKVWQCFSG